MDVDDDSEAVGLEQLSPVLPTASCSGSDAILETLDGMNQIGFGREGGLAGVEDFVTTGVIN